MIRSLKEKNLLGGLKSEFAVPFNIAADIKFRFALLKFVSFTNKT